MDYLIELITTYYTIYQSEPLSHQPLAKRNYQPSRKEEPPTSSQRDTTNLSQRDTTNPSRRETTNLSQRETTNPSRREIAVRRGIASTTGDAVVTYCEPRSRSDNDVLHDLSKREIAISRGITSTAGDAVVTYCEPRSRSDYDVLHDLSKREIKKHPLSNHSLRRVKTLAVPLKLRNMRHSFGLKKPCANNAAPACYPKQASNNRLGSHRLTLTSATSQQPWLSV